MTIIVIRTLVITDSPTQVGLQVYIRFYCERHYQIHAEAHNWKALNKHPVKSSIYLIKYRNINTVGEHRGYAGYGMQHQQPIKKVQEFHIQN